MIDDVEQGGDPACWLHLVDDSEQRPQIALVAGSLRRASHTARLLRRAGELMPERFRVVELGDVRALPHYDADLDGEHAPPAVRLARANVSGSAGLILSTPEYSGSIPGSLKNWIDWVTRPARQHVLVAKPVAVVGGAPNDRGASRAVGYLHRLLGKLGAVVVGDPLAVPNIADRFTDDGRLDDELEQSLEDLVAGLAAAVDERRD